MVPLGVFLVPQTNLLLDRQPTEIVLRRQLLPTRIHKGTGINISDAHTGSPTPKNAASPQTFDFNDNLPWNGLQGDLLQ